jgi:hypothetical protein
MEILILLKFEAHVPLWIKFSLDKCMQKLAGFMAPRHNRGPSSFCAKKVCKNLIAFITGGVCLQKLFLQKFTFMWFSSRFVAAEKWKKCPKPKCPKNEKNVRNRNVRK